MFMSFVYFYFIFVCDIKYLISSFCMWLSSFHPLFFEETIFSPLCSLGTLVHDQVWPYYVWVNFWILYSIDLYEHFYAGAILFQWL